MKKENLFLSLFTATLDLPSTLFVTPSLTFAEEIEEITLSKTNLDDPFQGSLPYEGKEITPLVKVTWTPKDEESISLVEN